MGVNVRRDRFSHEKGLPKGLWGVKELISPRHKECTFLPSKETMIISMHGGYGSRFIG